MATTAKPKTRKPVRSQEGKLSNAKLVRLARKRKPPQAWFDEGSNPFKPKR